MTFKNLFSIILLFVFSFGIATAATTIGNNITTGGNLTVSGTSNLGTSYFTGSIYASSTLGVTGVSNFYNNGIFASGLFASGTVAFDGQAVHYGNLLVNGFATTTAASGNIATQGTLSVGGTSSLTGDVHTDGALTATSSLAVSGISWLYGNLVINGKATTTASSGNINTEGVIGIGTTTPIANLSITQNAGQIAFNIGSSTATTFIINQNGAVGIGTSSPTMLGNNKKGLAIAGSLYVSGSTTVPELTLSNEGMLHMGSSTPQKNTLYQENLIKGWVQFNSIGTVRVADSFNVSSITDSGTGDFAIVWGLAFSNASYAFLGTSGTTSGGTTCDMTAGVYGDTTTTQARYLSAASSGGLADCGYNSAIALGDQ